MQGKAKDAGGLTPAKDDNAAMRALYPRTFARNSDDCYKQALRAYATDAPQRRRTPASPRCTWLLRFAPQDV